MWNDAFKRNPGAQFPEFFAAPNPQHFAVHRVCRTDDPDEFALCPHGDGYIRQRPLNAVLRCMWDVVTGVGCPGQPQVRAAPFVAPGAGVGAFFGVRDVSMHLDGVWAAGVRAARERLRPRSGSRRCGRRTGA